MVNLSEPLVKMSASGDVKKIEKAPVCTLPTINKTVLLISITMENQIVFAASGTAPVSKVVYTAKVHVTGGRDGAAKSSDGRLEINLSSPGTSGQGTNPEQLFAAGWAACFIGAMKHNASTLKIKLPAESSVDAEVDLASSDEGYGLQARLQVNLPGLSEDDAHKVVEAAHQTCPYSKATKGNIGVEITVTV
jgi:osmotically inducible protein OsmC